MFRKMTRFKQEIPQQECRELLKKQDRGVLSVFGDDGYPYGLPINHYYCEEENRLYFHSGSKGHKIDAIRKHDKASFCIYDEGYRKEGEWALNITSVIVFGRIEIIEDRNKIIDICRKLSYKFTDDETYIENEISRSGYKTFMFALNIEHMSGKRVNES